MIQTATIELRDLVLDVSLGTYGPDDVVPEAHVLDLDLTIDPNLALIPRDDMALVFDYDPLIARIADCASATKYETQERLITLILDLCAAYPVIRAASVLLRKHPVRAGSGSLGVRVTVDAEDLAARRGQ